MTIKKTLNGLTLGDCRRKAKRIIKRNKLLVELTKFIFAIHISTKNEGSHNNNRGRNPDRTDCRY